MEWFGKKENKASKENFELPRLPEIPKLSEVDDFEDDHSSFSNNSLPKLPSFPNNDFRKDFSKNFIKEAVVGKKEDDMDFADDSFHERTMQKPIKPLTREMHGDYDSEREAYPILRKQRVKETDPIYIRLDKFNESSKIFHSTVEKVNDIQRTLNEIKKIRQEEEADLAEWEKEIMEIKRQLDKVDREIFSGI